MAGQFCFCGDVGRGIDGGVGEDAGGGLVGDVGGVLFVVDGDVGEQGAVENASYGWFTLAAKIGHDLASSDGKHSGVGVRVPPIIPRGQHRTVIPR
ncbi:hypothetical protein DMY01_00570 [Cutibacterium avidum]|uniref:Uncharacterized protein n=1 Tax=Cutibacterium avidum TaxID=33010 RepID=A0A3E2DNI5_9ACTN|nr:hypothetical protein CHT91_00560 [Cutibacterium avidum]TMT55789.1 hypothetical protein DMY01_00570 [Cutibacterium avidum]